MSDWKLQTEEVIVKRENQEPKTIIVSKGFQKDEKGNILQAGGGIIPKACQNCGNEFIENQQQDELRQEINLFVCDTCKFETLVSEEALKHTIKEIDHKLKIKEDTRIVGYKTTLTGNIAIVTKTKNDVIILCRDCHDLN